MDKSNGAAALVAACGALLCLLVTGATAQTSATEPARQALHDEQRLLILQAELGRERQRLADVVRRRAERLAAGDGRGADEAEAARQRSMADIAALEREIGTANRPAVMPHPRSSAATSARTPSARPTDEPAWWDVYARPPRRAASQDRATTSPLTVSATPGTVVPTR